MNLSFRVITFDTAIAPQLPTGEVITCRPSNKQVYRLGQRVSLTRGQSDIRGTGTIVHVAEFGNGARQLKIVLDTQNEV